MGIFAYGNKKLSFLLTMYLKNILTCFVILLLGSTTSAQKFETSVEAGSFTYLAGAVAIKPGPNWKGYYLPRKSGTGFQMSSVNGFAVSKKTYMGIGLGFANFDGISGLQVYGNMRFRMNNSTFSPYFYFDPGLAHFWNQYPGGTSTFLLNLGIGVDRKIGDKSLRLSSGLQFMQQNVYVPVRIAFTL